MRQIVILLICLLLLACFGSNPVLAEDTKLKEILKKIDNLPYDEEEWLQEVSFLAKDCDADTAIKLANWVLTSSPAEHERNLDAVVTLLGLAGHLKVIPTLQKAVLEGKLGQKAVLSIALLGGPDTRKFIEKTLLDKKVTPSSQYNYYSKRMADVLQSTNWKEEAKYIYAMSFSPSLFANHSKDTTVHITSEIGHLLFPEIDSDFLINKFNVFINFPRKNPDWAESMIAAQWLALKKEKRIIPLLEEYIEKKERNNGVMLAEALGIIGDKDSMLRYLNADYDAWQGMLFMYVCFNVDEDAIDILKNISEELEDGEKKDKVIDAIKEISYKLEKKKSKKELEKKSTERSPSTDPLVESKDVRLADKTTKGDSGKVDAANNTTASKIEQNNSSKKDKIDNKSKDIEISNASIWSNNRLLIGIAVLVVLLLVVCIFYFKRQISRGKKASGE